MHPGAGRYARMLGPVSRVMPRIVRSSASSSTRSRPARTTSWAAPTSRVSYSARATRRKPAAGQPRTVRRHRGVRGRQQEPCRGREVLAAVLPGVARRARRARWTWSSAAAKASAGSKGRELQEALDFPPRPLARPRADRDERVVAMALAVPVCELRQARLLGRGTSPSGASRGRRRAGRRGRPDRALRGPRLDGLALTPIAAPRRDQPPWMLRSHPGGPGSPLEDVLELRHGEPQPQDVWYSDMWAPTTPSAPAVATSFSAGLRWGSGIGSRVDTAPQGPAVVERRQLAHEAPAGMRRGP